MSEHQDPSSKCGPEFSTFSDRIAQETPFSTSPVTSEELRLVGDGEYVVLAEHGRGGIGVVMRAHDRLFGRTVALKLLNEMTEQGRRRFLRELRITARLQHPSIVPVHDAALWLDGQPFYVMKLVEGASLKKVLAERTQLTARLRLLPNVVAVAEAMAYAHSCGIIHRDLKPSNVMVGEFGETVVIDWGLAKVLGEAPLLDELEVSPYRRVGEDDLTAAGNVLGTPAYMPPEQARGDQVDARADVYSIGAILYHVLGGRPPFQGESGAVLGSLRSPGERPPELASIAPAIPSDLASIVRKAMAWNPDERYADASELVADLTRFQAGKLIAAKDYSPRELMTRWVRKHRLVLTLVGTSLAAMAVLGTLSVLGIARERDTAQVQRDLAAEQRVATEDRNTALLLEQAKAIVARNPTAAAQKLSEYRQRDQDGDAPRWIELETLERGVATSETKITPPVVGVKWLAGDSDVAIWNDSEAIIWDTKTSRVVSRDVAHGFLVSGDRTRMVAYRTRADGATAPGNAFGPDSMTTKFYVAEAPTFEFVERSRSRSTGFSRPHSVSWDGRRLLTSTTRGDRYPTELLDIDAGTADELDHYFSPYGSAVQDDGLVVSPSLGIEVVGVRTERRAFGSEHGPTRRSWSDGHSKRFVLELEDSSLVEVDVASEHWTLLLPSAPIERLVALSEDGTWVAVANHRSLTLRRFGDTHDTFSAAVDNKITGLQLSRDGAVLAAGLEDGRIVVWQAPRRIPREIQAHEGAVVALDFSADGAQLVSVAADGTMRVWSLRAPIGNPMDRVAGYVLGLSTTDAGTLEVTDREIVLRDPDGVRHELPVPPERIVTACVAGSESNVLAESGSLYRTPLRSATLGAALTGVREITCSQNEATLAALALDGSVEVWRRGSHSRYEPQETTARLLALSSDGDVLFVASQNGNVSVWDLTVPPKCETSSDGPQNLPSSLGGLDGERSEKISGDVVAGGLWAVSTRDGASWNRPTVNLTSRESVVGEHSLGRTFVRFGRNASWTFSGGADGIVWARDNSGHERHRFHACHGAARDLQPSPTEPSVVGVACADGTVRLIDAATARGAVLVGQDDIRFMQFSEDGRVLRSLDQQGHLWQWDLGSVTWAALPSKLRDSSPASALIRSGQATGFWAEVTLGRLPVSMAAMLEGAVEYRRRMGTWPAADLPPTASCCWDEGVGAECRIGDQKLPAWLPLQTTWNPSVFRYAFHGQGNRFTAEALGDFDCDAISSRLLVEGHIDATGAWAVDHVDVSRLGF